MGGEILAIARQHEMPFGTRITPEGVRFRLWAPGCERVMLHIEEGAAVGRMMMPSGDGWFELLVDGAGPGTPYRFEVNDGLRVPDPASRFNPDDVHGASVVVDPTRFTWHDTAWKGRPWEEAVVYELHVGTFSPAGTFAGVIERLDYLVDLGITAIELMPVADFPGAHNWGYDGVLLFAPDSRYGTPDELKALVQAAHDKGLMVLLDVVYNHFGPEGNYLHVYARKFFSERHHTLWGAAINFDGPGSRTVRDFFIHNALFWLQEYHFDGLRLDAVHAIIDDSARHILTELAERVQAEIGSERPVHLILENDANEARYLGQGGYAAQWNDDIHHALHVLATGESDGYYGDYADAPLVHLGRCLTEGFAYQGQASAYHEGEPRGEPSGHLPLQAFVAFVQNHDQVGNRAFGERLTQLASEPAVRAAAAILLLAPSVPMLFMGDEFGARTPFQFFCDFGGELRDAVTQGRRREFRKFARFADPAAQAAIPDPNQSATFLASKLDWSEAGADTLDYYRGLLRLRRETIVPRLRLIGAGAAAFEVVSGALRVCWRLHDGVRLQLVANLSEKPLGEVELEGDLVFATSDAAARGVLDPWSVVWTLAAAETKA